MKPIVVLAVGSPAACYAPGCFSGATPRLGSAADEPAR